jgi:hypothetical protein
MKDRVAVDGWGFRGTIDLAPKLGGQLVCKDPEQLGEPSVFENYLRIITAYAALRDRGLFLHSAAVVADDRAFVFIGRSGAGKTTLSRMALAEGCRVLSDDANVLFSQPGQGYVAGPIPFAGELGQRAAIEGGPFPVAGIYWLEKGGEERVLPMSPSQQIMRLMVCAPVLNVDRYRADALFERLADMARCLPVKRLQFSKSSRFSSLLDLLKSDGASNA